MEREKRYDEKFVAVIESICQETGALHPVDDTYYESFVELSDEELVNIVGLILHETARHFNEKLFSGAWKDDDEMYEYVMLYLELIAEGKLAFNEETGKMVFLKAQGDPPSDDMWNRIQKRITSAKSAIRTAIIRNLRGD